MKKYLPIIMLLCMSLACLSLPSGATQPWPSPVKWSTATPIKETATFLPTAAATLPGGTTPGFSVSAAQVNLQPQDVPELSETAVEKPAGSQPLFPVVMDQSQVQYINKQKQIRIESLVTLLPDPVQQPITSLMPDLIRKGWPTARLTTEVKNLAIGDGGGLVGFTDRCGPGYATIFSRSNVAVVLLGCGEGVKISLVLNLSAMIDQRIPPALLPIPSPTVFVNPTDTPADPCLRYGLTAEECASLGKFTYSIKCLPLCPGCLCKPADANSSGSAETQEQGEIEISFNTGKMTLASTVRFQAVFGGDFGKITSNQYQLNQAGTGAYLLTFRLTGFRLELINEVGNPMYLWECDRVN